MNMNVQDLDCAICLQKCHHATQLPCGHIFCFLCVKGVAIHSKRCAMCRAEIPTDYLDHPVLLENLTQQQTSQEDASEEYQWYYEGRNGWWKYDERSNIELETAFSSSESGCTLLLAGAVYTIDFQTMIQIRRNDPTRRRRVRRDTPALPAKGVAGIKNLNNTPDQNTTKSRSDNNNSNGESNIPEVSEVIVIEDDNDDTNESQDSDSSVDIVRVFSTINILDPESPSGSHTESSDDT